MKLDDANPTAHGRFARSVRAELRNVRTTRGTQWTLGLVAVLWVIVAVCVAGIALLLNSRTVSISGALLGMGSAVSVFVPILAILIVAADWQSRDILTTFILEPRRHIVFAAKCTAAVTVCSVLIVIAGALAVLLAIVLVFARGSTVAWDVSGETVAVLLGSAAVGTLSGIAYGAASQRVALPIVFALVQGLAIDPLLMLIPQSGGSWFRLTSIVDAIGGSGPALPAMTSALVWLAVPWAVGFVRHQRADVQ